MPLPVHTTSTAMTQETHPACFGVITEVQARPSVKCVLVHDLFHRTILHENLSYSEKTVGETVQLFDGGRGPMQHCACSALCSRVLLSVWCGAALVRECCTLSMCPSLFRTGHAECMITEESTTSSP